jgi:hypothetical protein
MGRYVRVLDIGLPAPGELVAALLRRNRFSPSIIRYGNFFKRSGEIGLLRDTVVTSNFYNSVPTQWGIKPKRCDLSPLSVSVHWLLPSTPRPVGLNSLGTPFMIYWVDPGDELATFVRRRRFWQDLVIVQHDHAHEKETTLQTGVELQWILSLIGTGTGFWASMEREPGLGWMSQTEYRDRFDVKRLGE